jgi:hypothetical protein
MPKRQTSLQVGALSYRELTVATACWSECLNGGRRATAKYTGLWRINIESHVAPFLAGMQSPSVAEGTGSPFVSRHHPDLSWLRGAPRHQRSLKPLRTQQGSGLILQTDNET